MKKIRQQQEFSWATIIGMDSILEVPYAQKELLKYNR